MEKFLQKCKALWAMLTNNRISAKTSEMSNVQRMQKNIVRQAALTVLTVVLTAVILFAMVSAWYTNIAQTSGLTFEAEAWGFKGDITIDNEAIMAAPGDEGIIDLSVENESDSVSAVSVTVSKNGMVDEMQKRLFFYVDARISRNDETLDRVYLNRFEGYTYNVFNNSNLSLTSTYSNAPVIKWEWVYDVLGYYVLGKPVETVVGEETVKQMNVEEYLRPIVYDFDKATTNINTDGEQIQIEITTVDGKQTPAAFLAAFSKKDGYEGQIDAEKDLAFGNYYKVSVDKNGYGVYAYLCSYSDIQLATQYDSELGELAYQKSKGTTLSEAEEAMLRHAVTVSISAQKDDETAVQVSSAEALQKAISDGEANVIQLSSNITIPEGTAITVGKNQRLMLDLNEHTLTNVTGTAIIANPGSSLTIVNGALLQADQSQMEKPATTYGVQAFGAEVVMSNVTIGKADDGQTVYERFDYGVYVGDNMNNNPLDSRVYIKDSEVEGSVCAVFVSGNGLVSEQKSMMIIDHSVLVSTGFAISGNGTVTGNGRWGTDIQIMNNSSILGVKDPESDFIGTGIYQPQKDSTLTVTDSYVEGGNAIALKGGHVKIHNSKVVGCGEYNEPKFANSGFTDTGDALYIETHYEYEMSVEITGDSRLSHKAEKSLSFRIFEETATNVAVEIAGGIFDEVIAEKYLAEGYTQESGSIREDNKDVEVIIIKKKPQQEIPAEDQANEATE